MSYPKLMRTKDDEYIVIVMMYYADDIFGTGATLYSEDADFPVGQLYKTWHMQEFIPFDGAIKLENAK